MEPILSFNELEIGYKEKTIARNLSGKFYPGDLVEIIGANGSGKTTLIKTLLGELSPLKGQRSLKVKNVYYLKQNYSEYIHLPLTVEEILEASAKNLDVDSKLRWNDLSGGQKQQVLIQRAFNQKAELVILDEPLNHLDKEAILKVTQLIGSQLKINQDLCVIIISHIPLILDRVVSRILL